MSDAAPEQMLTDLNASIVSLARSPLADRPSFPFVAVTGLPRSGTTLLTQLLAQSSSVRPISNFVALFWGNPAFGFVARDMINLREADQVLESEYGRTAGIDSPHEAGRMWKRLLCYDSMEDAGRAHVDQVDWSSVAVELSDVTRAARAPVVSKAFHLGYHVGAALKRIPDLRVLRIRRDPVRVANSLVLAAEKYAGSDDGWVGLRPKGHQKLASLPLEARICLQVLLVEAILDEEQAEARRAGHGGKLLEIDFDELVNDTGGVGHSVAEFLGDSSISLDGRGIEDPDRSEPVKRLGDLLDGLRTHPMFAALSERNGGKEVHV